MTINGIYIVSSNWQISFSRSFKFRSQNDEVETSSQQYHQHTPTKISYKQMSMCSFYGSSLRESVSINSSGVSYSLDIPAKKIISRLEDNRNFQPDCSTKTSQSQTMLGLIYGSVEKKVDQTICHIIHPPVILYSTKTLHA